MTVISELITTFGFEVDQAAIRDVEKAFDSLEKTALVVAGAFAAVGAAIGAAFMSTLAAGEKALITAQRLGTTVEGIQELQIAAGLSGASADSLTTALERLSKAAYESSTNVKSKTARAFAELGIAVKDTNGTFKQTDVLFKEVAGKIAAIHDPTKQAALTLLLMGRSAGQLIPLLKEGAGGIDDLIVKAKATGNVLSKETAVALDDLKDSTELFGMTVQGLVRRFSVGLLPIAQKIVNTVAGWWDINRKLFEQRIDLWAGRVSTAIEYLYYALRFLVVAAGEIVDFFGGAKNVMLAFGAVVGVLVSAQVGALILAIGGLIAELGVLTAAELAAAAIPVALGLAFLVLSGLLFLVYQDLQSTNSLITDLQRNGIDPKASPLIKFFEYLLTTTNNVLDRIKILANFVGDFTKAGGGALGVAVALQRAGGAPDLTIEGDTRGSTQRLQDTLGAPFNFEGFDLGSKFAGGNGLAPAPLLPGWDSRGQNAGAPSPIDVTINNHISGYDMRTTEHMKDAVTRATKDGVSSGISKNKAGPL